MNINETLFLFNLDEKEAAIYLAALETGIATAREIAKKAGIQRTYFYDLSEKLLRLGLLQQINKGKKRYFQAAGAGKAIGNAGREVERIKKRFAGAEGSPKYQRPKTESLFL